MKRITLILFVMSFCFAPSMFAGFCKKCEGAAVVMMMGKCSACKGTTASAAYKYCKKCSKAKSVCGLCGKARLGHALKDERPAVKLDGGVVIANNACAVALYQQLKSEKGNLFISPYSIASAMAMVHAGARGNTAKEMAKALGLTMPQESVPGAFKALNGKLRGKSDGQKLAIANGLCLTGGDVGKEYKALLTGSFDAEIFGGGLDKINGWVKTKTEGKIEKILDELSGNSVCVLLNAIYFKGSWKTAFDEKRTHDSTFKVAEGKTVPVKMMYEKAQFKMLANREFKMLKLPYKGDKSSMIVLLPNAVDGLAALEKKITKESLSAWLKQLERRRTNKTMVYLPKFKLETKYDLVPTFKALGIKDAFEMAKADFSGMGWKKGSLAIAQIKHKAVVEVNEEGTEAAAATAVEMLTKSAKRYPVFRADHPFMFLIRDNTTGCILFLGRLTHPK